ncbi:uncharacterized protein LOC135143090 [Zophobas morio]|uniref:uncharacterized protein LOC135143090 n=1 Tax=Zophobas morio TaxID=2755281 RepID=UPI003082FDE6
MAGQSETGYLPEKQWSVVHFLATNTVASVPNNWIKKIEDQFYCYWPEGDKDVSKKVKKYYSPDSTWHFLEVRVLKQCDTYDETRRYERRVENESNTDIENGIMIFFFLILTS